MAGIATAGDSRITAALVAAAVFASSSAADQGPRVVYSTVATSNSSNVPVLNGLKFKWFDRPYVSYASAGSSRIVFAAYVNSTDPNTDEVIVMQQTLATPDPNNTRVVREGDVISGGVKNGPFRGSLTVDPNGNFVYSTNTTASDPNDEMLRRYTFGTPGSFSVVAYEHNTEGPNSPPIRLGPTLDSPSLRSDGYVAYRAASTRWDPNDPNLHDANKDEYLFWVDSSGAITSTIAQSGVTSPSGAVPSGKPWQFFDPDAFHVTLDGNHWLARGDLRVDADPNYDIPADDVLVRDGTVLMQEGQSLASGPNVGHIYREALCDPNGDWMAYGSYAGTDPNDFLVYNGSVIATTDANVPCDGADSFVEKYTDALLPRTFFLIAGNGAEYVYGGATNSGDPNSDEVLMYRRPHSDPNYSYHFPILRSGNRVDLDQNGTLDANDPRILSFKENSGVLTGGRVLYCVVELRSASGQAPIGQALIRFKICLGDVDRDGDTDSSDVGYLLTSEPTSPVPCAHWGT